MRTRWLAFLLCLLCLAGAWFFLHQKNGRDGSPSRPHEAVAPAVRPHPPSTAPQLLAAASTNGAASASTNPFPFRLSNTTKSLGQLVNDNHAILLENALIDTAGPLNLSIPTHLQSHGDPGAYIVQARGPIDAAFRAMLAAAGAEIVSYIPNNAYLVRAPAAVANGLAGNPLTQAVTPYEPYYKISSSMPVMIGQKSFSSVPMETHRAAGPSLLVLAVKQAQLPEGTDLTLGLFSNGAAETVAQIEKLGGRIVARDRSPFGPVVRVQPPKDWVALAALPGVQIVEPSHQRVPANDLSRVAVGVAANTRIPTNYLGLTGNNVIVEVNDSGIDATHPDFQTGSGLPVRVFGSLTTDPNGHGTHVAGIIAGNGLMSPTVTNASGSIKPSTTNQFRGMAPLAKLLAMDWYDSDQDLQAAAARTNALISNNSWNYGDSAYDLAAASYDAAVRDSLPGTTGSQPVLFVFSAGNSGSGPDTGGGGDANTILSPATAKNVITVGALEQSRNITNQVVDRSSNSSAYWAEKTDSGAQVAGYSSRGNVGVGTEGTYGRYKPDVVAPGSFVLSTRSAQFDQFAYYNPTNYSFDFSSSNQVVFPGTLTRYSLSLPANTIGAGVFIEPNDQSPTPFPNNLPIYVRKLDFPTTNNSDFITWSDEVFIPPDGPANYLQTIQNIGFFYSVGNTNNYMISYDLITETITTNDLGNYYQVFSSLNLSLGTNNPASMQNPSGPGPYYRYESGTSMAAADVSGVLALMQDFFTNKLSLRPSPALLKAMLINGARRAGGYDFQVTNAINYQGWGLVNLTNSLPPGITNIMNAGESMLILDQGLDLATGDSHTYEIDIPNGSNQQFLPLKITLAWTDPPGDPAAAIKLVNNLDLVVTNADTGKIYYGNDIGQGQIYNTPQAATNAPNLDSINNVENVFIQPLLSTKYFVTVIGRRVNVNAVTAHTNNVVQDYALVISCGNGQVTNAFTVLDNPTVSNPTADQQITYVVATNTPLLNQFVGASTPLLGTENIQLTAGGTELNGIQLAPTNVVLTLGMTNQWHFYVVTNPPSNAVDFTNAAFITFIPDTLSVPRMGVFAGDLTNATRPEADIDLYVSTNAALMTLDPVVISNADKSVGRGGVEFVYYTNSAPGDVYYVGVYSEDQEASEYGFIPIFTDIPFDQPGQNGSQIVNGLNLPVIIPDGNPLHPGIGYVFALNIVPMQVKRVVVNDTIPHQNFGDLIGTLTHSQQTGVGGRAVLNNHESLHNPSGIYTNIYDDSNQGDIAGARTSDGPGSLNNFVGQQGVGPWILAGVDDALTHTGSVTGFSLLIEPHQDLTAGINGTVCGNDWFYDYIDVPTGATNLTISATNTTPSPLPIFLYVNTTSQPTLTNFIAVAGLTNVGPLGPGGSISIGPPLTPGRYWVGIWNPNPTASPCQDFYLIAHIGVGTPPGKVIFNSSGPAPILDDAVITNSIYVTAAQPVSSVEAALRVDHPRVSDLVFHLTSPDGTRMLLVENRGGTTTEGMGQTLAITNINPATFSFIQETPDYVPSTNVIDTGQTSGTLHISYNFWNFQPDEMVVYYQGSIIFDSGLVLNSGVFNIPYGPGTNTQLTIVMNPTINPGQGDRWDYTVNSAQAYMTYLVLTEDTNRTTTPIKYAPTPFHGTVTLTSHTNLPTYQTNTVSFTNYTYTTNLVRVPNGAVGWHSSFEGSSATYYFAPSVFAEGWQVTAGSVVVITPGAYEGNCFIGINGTGPGTISTNVVTVIDQTYQLSFAYRKDPSASAPGVQLSTTNSGPLLTLSSVANLGWATTSVLFTATSPNTTFQFASLTSGAHGVYLDAIDLAPLVGSDGFEGATAGDYAQGHFFDGWYVNTNQVTVIADSTLANEGNKLLALAGGTISRLLLTMPGQIYTLTYAYRGPGIVSLWRGDNSLVDPINGNNGTPVNDLGYAAGEVNSAFNMGASGYVFVPASPSLDVGPGPGFTIDAWVDPTNISVPNPIVEWSQYSGLVSGQHFFVTSTPNTVTPGSLFAGFTESNNVFAGDSFTSAGNLVTNNGFQHVALTYNHVTGIAAMYVNGVMVISRHINVITPWTTGDVLIGRRINTGVPEQNFHFAGKEDEVSIYRRTLSASEIQAIYQKGSAGKYDPAAPTVAQGLAEAQITAGSTSLTFFGSNTNWLTNTITFTATQTNMPLQIAGIEPGMLLDNFVLTNLVITTNGPNITHSNVVTTIYPPDTTNASGGDVYYLPEQSLDTFKGGSAYGQWRLEVWDNRAGAGLTNTLVNWQLRFNFDKSLSSVGVLTNEVPVTNVIPAGSIEYYLVIVPTNADFATNRLLFATGPLNVWFNPTTLPAGTNPPDYLLLTNSTGGRSILSLTSMPTNIVPGGTYYLAVQNTGASTVTYGIEVDFRLVFPPIPPTISTQVVSELTLLTVTNTGSSGHPPLSYSVSISVDTNAMLLRGWPLYYVGPFPAPVISAGGIITWTPSEQQGPGVYTITTVITDSSLPPLSATNSFSVIVNEVNTAPYFLNIPTNQSIGALSTLIVNNAAGDVDLPPNPLFYTLINPPAGMTIDNNGFINWTPSLAQVLTTNLITTVVSDFNGYALVNQSFSITNRFTVRVTPVAPPYAFSQPATSVTGTSAQLNGMATPNGPPTTAWFDWGTSASYGNQTPPVNVGGSYDVVYVTSQINNLVRHQPYHFRLVVSNAMGVAQGFDQLFDETGVVAWGGDYANQTDVPPGFSNVVAVAGAYDHSLAVQNNGLVTAWGDNTKNQTNVPAGLSGVVAVAGGEYYSLALKNDGTVAAWGGNILGQTNVPAGLNGVVNIAGGTFSSLALQSSGRVVSWGANFANLTNVTPGLSDIVAVAGGGYHSLAIKNDGTVLVWGDNSAHQTNMPPGLSNVVAIAGGSYHSLALKYDGTVVAWGDDTAGQTNVPAGLSNVVAIAAGGYHSLVLKNDGSVLAWGDNTDNQTNIPASLSNVVAISSGYFHNLALASPFKVNFTNTPPFFLTNSLPPVTMNELTTLTVPDPAADSDLPPQTLTYTVTAVVDTNAMIVNGWPLGYATGNPPPTVNSSGVISWTPDEAQGPGVYFINTVVTDNGAPPLSATNSFTVTVNEVNTPPFWPPNVPSQTNYIINMLTPLVVYNTAMDTDLPPNPLTYQLSGPVGATIDANGIISWTPTLSQGGTTNFFTTVVTDTNPPAVNNKSFSATNRFTVVVTTLINLPGGQPQTNTAGAGSIAYYVVNVPANADFATNILLYATGPLRIWYDTNNPPTPNILLLPNGTYPTGTNGSVVLNAATAPPLVPASTYYLGVQNTGTVAVAYEIEVDFHLMFGSVTGAITGLTVTATNNAGTNGFLVQWQGPTNFQYEIQWTPSLLAPIAWHTVLNPVINVFVTATNGHFSFFDNGTLTGGLGPLKFYRVLGAPNLGPITTGSGPVTGSVLAGSMSQAVVAVPPNVFWASNALLYATGPLNVWFNQTNPPTGSTSAGDTLMLSAASAGVFVLTNSSVPPLVPGANYYLGFQSPGASNVTFGFQVIFSPALTNVVSNFSITQTTNGLFQLQWTAPTNYQFQAEWTISLLAPTVWTTNAVFITSTNGTFTFVDTNAPMIMKFYRLIEYP